MSLQQVDPVREAAPLLPALALRIGHTVALAVWGNRGATIVMIEESPAAVHVNMRRGTVFSIADTASGRLFAAWRPVDEVRALYTAERKQRPTSADGTPLPAWADFARELDEVRRQGLARTDSSVVPGVGAMSAPVFDHRGELVLAITSIGPSAAFDTRWDGPVGQALRDAAQAVSLRLGHRPAPAGGG